jgi:uncharacterized protein YoxC
MTLVQMMLTVFLVVLAIVAAVVGVQLVLVLNEIRRTLSKVNQGVEKVERQVSTVLEPLKDLRHMAMSVKAGVSLIEKLVERVGSDKSQTSDKA